MRRRHGATVATKDQPGKARLHAMIDDTIDLADSATPENWQVVLLRIWARQWRAGKLALRVFGTRTEPTAAAD